MKPPRILHAHSTFTLGGKEARAIRLMNAFGDSAEHVVLSAVPGALAARAAIDSAVRVTFPDNAPSLAGLPALPRYRSLARYMAGFDLVLTYNWGAMDAVMAHRLFAPFMRLPPLIHHEDGFNADEVERQKPKRIWFRRLALPTVHALVVPSERLERIARDVWHQPAGRVVRIANGIPTAAAAQIPAPGAIPGLARRPGEVIVGTLAGLCAVKNLPRLVRAFAAAGVQNARLVVVGEGPERAVIMAEAARCGIADRLILPGFLPDPLSYVGLFDIFALSSDSEQFPISLVEAMAAGLPAVTTEVGDIAAMVAPQNRPYIVPVRDEAKLAEALAKLIGDSGLREAIGQANRAKAIACFDEASMIRHYAGLYRDALGRTEPLD